MVRGLPDFFLSGLWAADIVNDCVTGSGAWRDCPAGGIVSLMVLSILSLPLWGMILIYDRHELVRSPGMLSVSFSTLVVIGCGDPVCFMTGGASPIFMGGIRLKR